MHSTTYTRMARAADQNAWEVVAFMECLPSGGRYPAALVVCKRDAAREGREYLTTTCVFPDDRSSINEPDAFFITGSYDLTFPEAIEHHHERCREDIRATA